MIKEKIKKFMEDQKVKDIMNIAIPVVAVCATAVVVILLVNDAYEPQEREIDPVLFAKFKAAMEAEGLI